MCADTQAEKPGRCFPHELMLEQGFSLKESQFLSQAKQEAPDRNLM